NLLFAFFLKELINKKVIIKPLLNLTIFFLIILVLILWGKNRIEKLNSRINQSNNIFNVVILQGNIDQYKKWSKQYVKEIMDTYTNLVYQGLESIKISTTVVLYIWPESSVPGWLFEEEYLYNWISQLVKNTNKNFPCYHLIGTVRMGKKRMYEYHNSAVLMSMKNNQVVVEEIYDKIHLVPFGEYVPFRKFLGKFIKTVNELGEFTAGKNYTVFRMNLTNSPNLQNQVNFSVLICYESIFPELTSKFIHFGSKFIVNITNDAWFLKTSAPYQHFIFNIFRAIENRCYVFRSANTGISGIISPTGEILFQTKLFEKDIIVCQVKIFYNKTFYTKFHKFLWLLYLTIFIFSYFVHYYLKLTLHPRNEIN
ncbi:MAG: apolipoprotein N-acyltransferase, partial [Endomicrobia bacterium]|nr:apolipoprotein N-acyltransferase [Endomicrobiia bacterium]